MLQDHGSCCRGSLALAALALTSVALTACSADSRVTEYRNQGKACLIPHSAGAEIGPDEPVRVRVTLDECGSSCDTVEDAHCETTFRDRVIRVTSGFLVRAAEPGTQCTGECVDVGVTCELGVLPVGTHRIDHGGFSRQVNVPGVNPCE